MRAGFGPLVGAAALLRSRRLTHHHRTRDVDDASLVDITDDRTLAGSGASGGVVSTADELAR